MRPTELSFEIMLRPEWLNGSQTYHGGEMLKLMDELCGSLATVYDPRTYVTGFIHGVSLSGSPTVRNIIRGHATICYTTARTVAMEVTLYYRKRSELQAEEKSALTVTTFLSPQTAQGRYSPIPRPMQTRPTGSKRHRRLFTGRSDRLVG